MAKHKRYELYKKSKFVCVATLDEICEITGYSKSYAYQCVVAKNYRHQSSEWFIYPIEKMQITFDDGQSTVIDDPNNLAKWLNIDRRRLFSEIKRRVNKLGWSIEKSLNQRIKKRKDWDNIIFSMYKGEDEIGEGTIYELSQEKGYSLTYLKSVANGVIVNKGELAVRLVQLDDEEF